MNLDTFFEKFELFADAPGAVAKMRELVLRLAFSGGLTANRPSEQGVPEGWETRTIESISASISPGFACSRSHQVEGGHVHLRTHNISTLGSLNFDLLVCIDPKMVDKQKASIRAGDILFNNTNSQELVGKTSLVDRDYDYGFSNHITRIRLKEDIFPGFVVFYLTFLRNSGYFSKICTRWINQAAVNTDTLKEQTVPLPPLAEQKRIVAKVDELMALCDRLEAQQKERETRHAALARASLSRFAEAPTPANLDFIFHKSYTIDPADLRKSILTLAVQGKLVPQDAGDEPAEHLVNQIAKQKEALLLKKEIPKPSELPRVVDEDLPFDLPFGWQWIRLESVCEVITKGSSPTWQGVNYVDAENGVLFITSENVGNYALRKMDEPKYVERRFNEMETRSILQRNDLLVNLVGASIGRSAIYDRDEVANINQAVGIIRLVRGDVAIDRWYLLHYLNSPTSLEIMFDEKVESARANLSLTNMKHFLCPIPPLAEQRRIVAKVDQLMALVDQLETQLAASRAAAEKLLEALVAELTST